MPSGTIHPVPCPCRSSRPQCGSAGATATPCLDNASQALIAPSTSCGPTSSDARKPACMLQLPACAGSVYVPRCLNLSDTRISTPHRERACDPHPSDTERGSARSDARKHGRGRAGRRTRGPCHSKGHDCRQPCRGHGLSTAVVPDTPLRAAGSPPAASRPLYSLMDLTLTTDPAGPGRPPPNPPHPSR